jgi:uncharacterized protein (TIGR04222 family)
MASLDPRDIGGVRELVVFAAAVLAAWLVALVLRAILRSGGHRLGSAAGGEPGPEDVAYLTGGPRQAVYGAVAALRSTGCVQAAGGRVFASGPVPAGTGELAAAVHHAAVTGVVVGAAVSHPAVGAVLLRASARLLGQGALLSPGRRWAMGLVAAPLFLLMLFGLVRCALNLLGDHRKPLESLLTLIVSAFALAAGSVLASRAQIRTRGADRLVRELRRRYAGLAPRYAPSLTGNGPAAATLAVGLFGTAALWTADPAFARAAELEEQRVTAGGGYGGDGGYREGADSSCGGGSCGTG